MEVRQAVVDYWTFGPKDRQVRGAVHVVEQYGWTREDYEDENAKYLRRRG